MGGREAPPSERSSRTVDVNEQRREGKSRVTFRGWRTESKSEEETRHHLKQDKHPIEQQQGWGGGLVQGTELW